MATEKNGHVFLGIDVGTSSVRAIAVRNSESSNQRILGTSIRPITIHNPQTDHFEQSTPEIWAAICDAIHELLDRNLFNANSVKGIGFDATSSLVILDGES